MSNGGEFCKIPYPDDLIGKQLVGRELLICWVDGSWYEAVVVAYYPAKNEYKLVYRQDDGIEVISLDKRRWVLLPKKHANLQPGPILDGAIIEFEYPRDQKRYKAMIYAYSEDASRLEIAYLEEHSTDSLKGEGWELITPSPCLAQGPFSSVDVDKLYEHTMETVEKNRHPFGESFEQEDNKSQSKSDVESSGKGSS